MVKALVVSSVDHVQKLLSVQSLLAYEIFHLFDRLTWNSIGPGGGRWLPEHIRIEQIHNGDELWSEQQSADVSSVQTVSDK